MSSSTNINNLNVLTFIKDIYMSLKHIDTCFNSYKETIDNKLINIIDNHNIILDKLNNIEQLINKLNTNTQKQNLIDSKIEHELLEKMNMFNKSTDNNAIQLKASELTFANILENNYNILDINNTSDTHNFLNSDTIEHTTEHTNNGQHSSETLDSLLF